MGISFGSTSVKPYVGSKEVKEAYVGSQLVYRATPPYVYEFLGAENNYYISDKMELTSGAAIQKILGIYRLACASAAQFWIRERAGSKIAFQAYYTAPSGTAGLTMTQYANNSSIKQETIRIAPTSDFTLYSVDLLPETTQIKFNVTSIASGYSVYLDAIRFEQV